MRAITPLLDVLGGQLLVFLAISAISGEPEENGEQAGDRIPETLPSDLQKVVDLRVTAGAGAIRIERDVDGQFEVIAVDTLDMSGVEKLSIWIPELDARFRQAHEFGARIEVRYVTKSGGSP